MRNQHISKILFSAALVASVFLTSCYEPVANNSGDFKNKRETPAFEPENTSIGNKEESVNGSNNDSESISGNNEMSKPISEKVTKVTGFRGNLTQNLSRSGLTVSGIVDESNPVEKRILDEYGAVFLSKAAPPNRAMFTSDAEVSAFQTKAGSASANIGGASVELQPAAMKALQNAISDAKTQGLKITPRDGSEAAKRSYQKTLTLWKSRFEPALKHWKSKKRLKDDQISRLRSLPIKEQVGEVLKLEKQGIYFNTFFNKTILSSVAAPGTSQHLSMLAFDATEFGNKKVRAVMAKHGWFRTVQDDEPHFTYLGYQESELLGLGLKKISTGKGEFWIPNI